MTFNVTFQLNFFAIPTYATAQFSLTGDDDNEDDASPAQQLHKDVSANCPHHLANIYIYNFYLCVLHNQFVTSAIVTNIRTKVT